MSLRLKRVKSQLQRILGEIFSKKGLDFGVGFISINDILISRDLSQAKIWVSFTGVKNQEAIFKRLTRKSKLIQSLVYKKLLMKRAPKLLWYLDKDPQQRYKIESILDDIKSSQDKDSKI